MTFLDLMLTGLFVAVVIAIGTAAAWGVVSLLRCEVVPAIRGARRWVGARIAERKAWRWHQAAARRREMLKPRDGGRPW